MIYRDIGKKIQKAREEAGLSQEELASRLGYTQAALSNYELGKRRLYLANIEQIARELNKPLSYFWKNPPCQQMQRRGNLRIKQHLRSSSCYPNCLLRRGNISLNILSGGGIVYNDWIRP